MDHELSSMAGRLRADNSNEPLDVKSVCKAISAALKKRTGRAWSVTHGRGTAYGWITIHSMPAKRDECGFMSNEDRACLANALGLERVSHQGESVPASNDHRREYLQRARFGAATQVAEAYWD